MLYLIIFMSKLAVKITAINIFLLLGDPPQLSKSNYIFLGNGIHDCERQFFDVYFFYLVEELHLRNVGEMTDGF